MLNSTVVRVPKAGEMIAAHLRRQIVTGELREGDALMSESELMEQFGVSRPTLREAFRILESEQIIQIRRGARGGARVLLPDIDVAARYAGTLLQYRKTTLADVHEARVQLEAAAVAILARKRSAADLRRLDAMVAEGERVLDDPVAFGRLYDLEFHRLLMELAGNQTMIVLLDILYSIIAGQVEKFVHENRGDPGVESTASTAHRAHVKLVQLIRDKNPDKAVAFWRSHLTQVKEFMMKSPEESVLDVLQ
ncbi:FadR/GntR family transcriptional regulator [Nocardia jinanensis]|uniref:GntR family transcriptional regulator n=1 Tax=Nocardia jinanensis TaxID=382504 RepID=A0A917RL23_9NOCA|nr:FCD domain-containing protein [Nocardia jinanensis]GGL12857.1 GntR family transcriptional regulator [Nocardia jinanensis]